MKIHIIITLTFLLAFLNISSAQWIRTSGPDTYGGHVNTLYSRGNYLYAGTNGYGIFISSNGGASWSAINNGLGDLYVSAITSNAQYLIAGTSDGLFLSSNNGNSWIQATNQGSYYSLLFAGNILYAGTPTGLFSTDNYGLSWSTLISLGGAIPCVVTQIGPGNVRYLYAAASKPYPTNSCGIYVSTDEGHNWTHTYIAVNAYAIIAYGANIFAGTGNGVIESTDYGYTWVNTKFNGYTNSLAQNGDLVLAGNVNGIYVSNDFGNSWNLSLDINQVSSLLFSGEDVFAGTSTSGILLTTNYGISWNSSSTGLPRMPENDILSMGDNIFTGTGGTGVFETTDNGTSWVPKNNGLFNRTILRLAADDQKLYALSNTGIYYSSDYGESWSFRSGWGHVLGAHSSRLFICNDIAAGNQLNLGLGEKQPDKLYGISVSTDNGLSWVFKTYVNFVYTFEFNGNEVIAGVYNGVLKSPDLGDTWNLYNTGLPQNCMVKALLYKGNYLFAGISNYGVYSSTDDGLTWNMSGFLGSSVDRLVSIPQGIMANVSGVGPYFSTDYGANWIALDPNFAEGADITSLAVNGNSVFAATANDNVWKYPINEITGVNNRHSSVPDKFALYQNYPNPFNPTTIIKFDIPANGSASETQNVKLAVYDILGKQIALLVNEQLKPGRYEFKWDGSKFSSGIYFYRLTTGSYTDSRKMLLVK